MHVVEFKRMLESQLPSSMDDMFDIEDDDLQFDTSDRDRLNMLEKYRNNLIAGARQKAEVDTEDSENLRL